VGAEGMAGQVSLRAHCGMKNAGRILSPFNCFSEIKYRLFMIFLRSKRKLEVESKSNQHSHGT
jgi:hypothetical protein